jgi:hypothetical protein
VEKYAVEKKQAHARKPALLHLEMIEIKSTRLHFPMHSILYRLVPAYCMIQNLRLDCIPLLTTNSAFLPKRPPSVR